MGQWRRTLGAEPAPAALLLAGLIAIALLGSTHPGPRALAQRTSASGPSALGEPVAGHFYWADANLGGTAPVKIRRALLDGSGVESLIQTAGPGFDLALDVDAGKMYWSELTLIRRASLDGTAAETVLVDAAGPVALGLHLAAGKIYWTTPTSIRRANLDGSNVETLVNGLGAPRGLAFNFLANRMAWTESATGFIKQANLDGSSIDVVLTNQSFPQGIVVDAPCGMMYWTDNTRIRAATFNGTNVVNVLSNLINPIGLALDPVAQKLYWTENGINAVERANVDGSSRETLVTQGIDTPWGIALDTPGNVTCGGPAPSPTPTQTGTPTATGQATETPSATSTPAPTETPGSATPTEAPSQTPTATPTPSASVTASRTVTASATGTATPSATATGTHTATPTPSQTATPVPPPPQIIGFGMGIETSGVALSWPAGTAETGYLVLRSAGGSTTAVASLGASATGYLDTSFRFGPACYMLVGLSGFPPLASAFSPQLCTIPGFSSTSGAPGSFTLRLTSATAAVLTWQAPPGVTPDGYLLIPLGGEPVVLAANATSSAQPVSGTACFWLLVLKGGAVSGQTDLACTIT